MNPKKRQSTQKERTNSDPWKCLAILQERDNKKKPRKNPLEGKRNNPSKKKNSEKSYRNPEISLERDKDAKGSLDKGQKAILESS